MSDDYAIEHGDLPVRYSAPSRRLRPSSIAVARRIYPETWASCIFAAVMFAIYPAISYAHPIIEAGIAGFIMGGSFLMLLHDVLGRVQDAECPR